MTSVEWLVEELKKVHHPTEAMIMYAKKLEKQQIIDAFGVGCHLESKRLIGYHDVAEQHYNETYGSKGSDEEKTNSQRFDEFMQLVTSSQTEISDEEIEKAFTDASERLSEYKEGLIDGAKWYREQLKLK